MHLGEQRHETKMSLVFTTKEMFSILLVDLEGGDGGNLDIRLQQDNE